MSAVADVTPALQAQFPAATPRPLSADHEALNLPVADLVSAIATLRDAHGYDLLADLTALDNGVNASPRFTVIYHLLNSAAGRYVRLAADLADDAEPVAPSIVSLYAGANWHERECFDMFGIRFSGHPDLRRILMWDGYPYHPLRKDFPLAGIETPLPDVEVAAETGASVIPAPMVGGPFVASSGEMNLTDAEPMAKDESWNEKSEKPAAK